MKRAVIGFIFGLVFALSVPTVADTIYQFTQSPYEIYVDGVKINTPLYLYQGTNYAPLRAVGEALGLDIKVNGKRADFTTPLTDLETVVKNCKDSCVMVYAYRGNTVTQGSGWFYNGYIVTAKHVVEGMERFTIELDNWNYGIVCNLYYQDPDIDLAILKPVQTLNLPSVTLGDMPREGQKLVSITSPLREKNYIDECIYVGLGQNISYSGLFAVSESEMAPGSSGGAIFNYNSELVGMVIRGEQSHYAIPASKIKPILEQQIK